MPERNVRVRFIAEILNFKKGMEEAAAATEKVKKASEEAGKAAQKNADELAKAAEAHQNAAKAVGLQYDKTGQLIDANGKSVSSQQAAAHGLQAFSKEAYLAAHAADEAAKANAKADSALQKIAKAAEKNREEWERSGAALMGFGAAAVGGLALAGKAAMDWESAWAGVTKTVDGSPEQMDALESSLRGLAKTLPATHEEIAGVAEAAGQLGVKREDVAGFTKTMIDLGETTNLSAEDAATGIAQISNVMGTMSREGSKGVERFGATLVALGNAGASTEAEILDMAKRIAGAAKLVGASESDVLALSNAMASVGIEAQLGGGVISRVMQRMYGDVMKGGKGLEDLAKVAGVSSAEFAQKFGTEPVQAVDMVVKGLARVKDEGGNVMDTMAALGIEGTEETSVMLRLAGAGNILADSLKLGDSAWKSNTALVEEASKRYETTESKVKIAWNNIKDAAIDAGSVILPAVAGIAEGVAGMASAFGGLPEPVKGVLTVLGGVAGVAALGAGAFLTLTPKILDTITAFDKLAPSGSKARGALMGVGKAAGAAMAVGTVTLVLAKLAEADYMSKIDEGMGKVSLALANVASASPGAASALDTLFKDKDGGDLINTVTDLESAIKRTFNRDGGQQFNDWGEGLVNAMTGVEGSSQILEGSFKRLDKGLAELVAGGKSKDASTAFESIKQAAERQGVSVEQLATKFPQYADALKAAEAAAKDTKSGVDGAAGSMDAAGAAAEAAAIQSEEIEKALEEIGLAADGSVTSVEKWTQSLFNAGLLSLSASNAAVGYQAAIDAVTESVKTNGTTLDINTEQGRANQTAFNGVASAAMAAMTATAEETLATEGSTAAQAGLQSALRTSYDDLVAAAGQFGITGDQADAMARKALGIPKEVPIDTWVNDQASAKLDAVQAKASSLDGKRVSIGIYTTEYFDSVDRRSALPDLNGEASGSGRPGIATGGRVADVMAGFNAGGRIAYPRPSDMTKDNVLGLVNGKPVALQGQEWVINGRNSVKYDSELAAINAGTFPKFKEYSAAQLGYAPAHVASASAAAPPNVRVFIGNEQIDARIEYVASSSLSRTDSDTQRFRTGGR